MSKSITQDMAYRQSLMKYAEKYGVSKASRKYNKSRSYIYFWRARWDGSVESLACQSRQPHHHPNQHTEAELGIQHKLIRPYTRDTTAKWNAATAKTRNASIPAVPSSLLLTLTNSSLSTTVVPTTCR